MVSLVLLLLVSVYSWVCGVALSSNYGVKSVVFISGVVDNSFGTISLEQGVRSFDHISVAGFPLIFHVTGMGIMDAVLEIVVGGSLKANYIVND